MKKNIILGVGTDIEDIGKFRNLNRRKDIKFLNKIFTEKEMDYCFSKENPGSHLAARFTGKEAVIKALSDAGEFNVSRKEIEIINKKAVPKVFLKNKSLEKIKINISLSHEKNKAIAFAIVTSPARRQYQ